MTTIAHIAAALLLFSLASITIFGGALIAYLFRPEVERFEKVMHFSLVAYFWMSLAALPFCAMVLAEWVFG